MVFTLTSAQPTRMADSIQTGRKLPPPPIGVLGSGSAGANLALHFTSQMAAARRQEREQFLFLVNFNQVEIHRIRQLLGTDGGSLPTSTLVVMPESGQTELEGFQGDPTAWKHREGLLRLELEELVSTLKTHAEALGAAPRITVDFFVPGGGHAELGLIAHEHVQGTFPNSFYLPVLLIPNDPTQYGWIRIYTWEKFEQTLADLWALIVDNNAASQQELNDRLTIGLTSLDTCSSSSVTQGSLSQAIASLLHQHTTSRPQGEAFANGFFRMAVVREPLPSKRGWQWGFPLRRRKLLTTTAWDLAFTVRLAIKECLESGTGLLDTNPPPKAGVPQIVAVTLPVPEYELSVIASLVKAMLSREEWWEEYNATTSLLFGSVNFPDPMSFDVTKLEKPTSRVERVLKMAAAYLTFLPRLGHQLIFARNHKQQDLYLTVTRLFVEEGPIERLLTILKQPMDGVFQGCGLGTRRHLGTDSLPQNSHEESVAVPP